MNHYELCRAVAERVVKRAWVALYEYQSYATDEFPDVLTFGSGGTVLYEIKTSRADFLADAKKDARKKWRPKVAIFRTRDEDKLLLKALGPELFYIEKPHLGSTRYFVCEPGVIEKSDLPEGWGLYWFKGGKMFLKAKSKKWRPDVHSERNILAHALRRFANGNSTGILVNMYDEVLK
jgi:hypothetical protein